ncbi:MAG: class B sortase [Clostridia bacterium]
MLSALLLVCIHGVGKRLWTERNASKRMEALRTQVNGAGAEIIWITLADVEQNASTSPAIGQTLQLAANAPQEPQRSISMENLVALRAQNQDFVGWLRLNGTKLDYPVMQSLNRPRYYLRRDFLGEKTGGGLPFIDEGCDLTGNRANLIIYGHNMKNGTMFGDLKRLQKQAFYELHRTLTFDTPERAGTYRIVSVYLTEIRADVTFKFYQYTMIDTEEAFHNYCQNVAAASQYPVDTEFCYGDELLTLVTCSNHAKEGRLVVVAKRIAG